MTRHVIASVLAVLVLAPAARAATVSTDSARDPSLPPSQDFSHIDSTVDPITGTWSVAYTFFGPPSADAWGNLGARLFVGASQCADFQAAIAGFQQAATLPGDSAVSGSVIPPPDRVLRGAQSVTKTVEGNTITLTMTDSSLIGTAGAVTLRAGGKLVARTSYRAKSARAVTVSLKLTAKTLRSLKRHRSLSVILTATAQAGTQVATKAVHARVRS